MREASDRTVSGHQGTGLGKSIQHKSIQWRTIVFWVFLIVLIGVLCYSGRLIYFFEMAR